MLSTDRTSTIDLPCACTTSFYSTATVCDSGCDIARAFLPRREQQMSAPRCYFASECPRSTGGLSSLC